MRSLVRVAVAGAFSIAAVLGTAGLASATHNVSHNTDVDGCQVVSCNTSYWNWNFSDDDTQGMNFGSVID